jgi:GH24 family phage-related lysozyme (muramidase)
VKMNEKGLHIIKTFEGLRLKAYRCPAGYPTIGYGHIVKAGEPQAIDNKQAEAFLKQDILVFEKAVASLIKVTTTEDQFSALVSFAYNVGSHALEESTLLKLHNARQFVDASLQFDRWCKARMGNNLKPLSGLIRRRDAEEALYKSDIKTLDDLLAGQGATA